MSIVDRVICGQDDLGTDCEIDPLVLTSEERARPHFVGQTQAGRTIRVSLERGTELHDGDVLHNEDGAAIVVKAADEDLLLLRPGDDPLNWWGACYQLGNLHRPARFLDDGVLTPGDPMALAMLAKFGISVETVRRPFTGRRFGAAHQHHHNHESHTHGHDHAHGAPGSPPGSPAGTGGKS